MDAEFWIGIAVLPLGVVAFILLRLLYAWSTTLWGKLHLRLIQRIELPQNPVTFTFRGEEPKPKRVEYEDAANKMRDAMLLSPRILTFFGLGWYVVAGRDIRGKDK